ncbi:Lactotransferrin [Bienertia sinuspersici]
MIDVFIEHDDCDDEGNNVAINSTITEQSIPKNIVNSFVSVNCENNNQEIEKDVDYDELGSDNEDDEVREARFLIQDEKKAENEYLNEEDSLVRLAGRKGKILEDNDGDYEDDSSDFESPPNSEDEDDYGYLLPKDSKKKKVKMASNQLFFGKNEQQCPFYLGQEFENASEFKKAVTNYSVRIGRDLQYSRNDAKRVGVKCKVENCSFYIWTSLESCKKTFIVKTLKPQHNCGRVAHIRKLRASWIAETYHAKFKVNPYLKCQEIVDTIWSEWGVKASLWLALKARRAAQTLILGEYKEQYGLLYRYSNEIMKSNPNNTIKFKLDNGIFERVYICFDAIKKGFLAGCRPFFGIDGCFLKGPFGGQLLVVVGRDGNNQMFPIAWACVEVENTETWGWFFAATSK